MKIDDVIDQAIANQATSPEEIRLWVTDITKAEDLSRLEKDAFMVGYMAGLMYGAQVDEMEAFTELLLRIREAEE